MQVSGIIFDFDGTLLNSLGLTMESFHHALHRLGEPARAPEEIQRYFGSSADRIFLRLLQDEVKAQKAFTFFLQHIQETASQYRLHEGILETLQTISDKKIPLAIVTGRHEKDLAILLQEQGISSLFQSLIADNQLQYSKPHPEGILLATKHLNIPAEEAIYIGDSATDIQAAHAAGTKSIAATWDKLANPQMLQKENPHLLATHPLEILQLLT